MSSNRDDSNPFILSTTVDFPDDVVGGLYTPELIDKMMAQCRTIGIRRVYWIYYGDIDMDSYWAGGLFHHPGTKYGIPTLERTGEPLRAAVPLAHKHGLEIYGVLKPYNTGASGTYPEGSPEPKSNNINRIGGTVFQVSPFVERYPHTRLRRRPYSTPSDLDNITVEKIKLLKKDDSPTRIKKENLQIWTSENNYRYQHKEIPFNLTDAVELAPRDVYDYFGDLVTVKGAPVRTLTLDGLNLTDRFILITTNHSDEDGDFKNTPISMIEAYGNSPEPLPIVVATRSATWIRPRDFHTYGLEFDSGMGTMQVTLDEDATTERGVLIGGKGKFSSIQSGGFIAFARGKNDYVPSMPCEIYPEVRTLWDGWIDRILDTGVDGLDIRVSSHGNLVDEPWEYGFNQPVLDEYYRRYKHDLLGTDTDLARLAGIRCEHYTIFVRETSEKVRRVRKKMQVHIHAEAFRPNLVHGQIMGIPPNLHFEWQTWLKEGLVDGITLRTSWFEGWEDASVGKPSKSRMSMALADPVADEALRLAQEMDVHVYLNRYLSRFVGLEEYVSDIESAFNDSRIAGFDIYEYSGLARATHDGSSLVPTGNRIKLIQQKAKGLGLV